MQNVRLKMNGQGPIAIPSRNCHRADERPLSRSAGGGPGVWRDSVASRPLFRRSYSEADRPFSASLGHSADPRERLRWVGFCQSASEPELA